MRSERYFLRITITGIYHGNRWNPISVPNISMILKVLFAFFSAETRMPLFKLLMQTLTGKSILFKYANEKQIMKKELCHIIVENQIDHSVTDASPFS